MRDLTTIKALLIEDNLNDAELILRYLKQSRTEFEVVHEQTIRDGLLALERETVDVIALDLALPNGAGITSFERVHNRFPEIPIVVLTGRGDAHLDGFYSDDAFAERLIRHGAYDYLHKNNLDKYTLVRSLKFAVAKSLGERAEAHVERLETKVRDLERALGEIGNQFGEFCNRFNSEMKKLDGNFTSFDSQMKWVTVQMQKEEEAEKKRKWKLRVSRQAAIKIGSAVASGGLLTWLAEWLFEYLK
jgi:DNA-binding NarL/FixJ family response regulator